MQSSPVSLMAGHKYYIEVMYKAGDGNVQIDDPKTFTEEWLLGVD